jgi:uncharacterized protein (UPF0276 family)
MSDKFLGFGLGLRTQHFATVINDKPNVDWFEIIYEKYMVAGGKPRYYLDKIRVNYPIVMHDVSMSIGRTDPLNYKYLAELKLLAKQIQPQWMSKNLCFVTVGGINSYDLLPIPYTQQSLGYLTSRTHQVQDFLGREMTL